MNKVLFEILMGTYVQSIDEVGRRKVILAAVGASSLCERAPLLSISIW